MSDLRIRKAHCDGSDVAVIYELLSAMFDESPMCVLQPWMARREIDRVCCDERAWIVEEDGRVVATMGLARAEFWYSDDTIWATRWLYARPAYRSAAGPWKLFETEAMRLADETDRLVLLDVHNPARAARRAAIVTRATKIIPAGVRLRISPKEAA